MKAVIKKIAVTVTLLAVFSSLIIADCTNVLVSKGASKDGSTMITYSADGSFAPRLLLVKAQKYKVGEMVDVMGWEDYEVRGQVKAVGESYAVVGLINQFQVSIGETTTGGRRELYNKEGMLDYDGLMFLALKRAKTAREAIVIIDQLVTEYGYGSSGESFSIADKKEVWLMEIIGKGPGVKGANWVAARVPDGCISAHANQSRIREFPLDDPENWLYSKDIIDFAVEKGYYDPNSGKPFSFRDVYHGEMDAMTKRVCAGRVWAIYNSVSPGKYSPDYFRGKPGVEDYPLFIKPDNKLDVRDVMELMRDHFEGTPYDMTKGIDAGPYGSPYRWRGLGFKVDEQQYTWERPISTMQAGFVMLCQSRDWLPDEVGGVYWYTPDDANTSVFLPLYCGISSLPENYTKGDYNKLDFESAWWVFNVLSNFTYDRYSVIHPEIEKVQKKLEQNFVEMMEVVDKTAAELGKKNPELMVKYLTQYSVSTGDELFRTWKALMETTLMRHIDFAIHGEDESARTPYPEEWLRRVIKERGEYLKLPEAK